MTTEGDRAVLVRLARDAIVAYVGGVPAPIPEPLDVLSRRIGVFVTIHNSGDLRGCIGHIEPDEPLGILIPRCAIAACCSDPRFSPVSAPELPHLDIELSLLGPLEPIAGRDDFEIGRHGLIVEMDRHRGLLLPQVAVEWSWDREIFLAQTCHKAGLRRDAWKHGARIWKFEAEVFSGR